MAYPSPHRLRAYIKDKATPRKIGHTYSLDTGEFISDEYTVPAFRWRFLDGIVGYPRNLIKPGFWKATYVTLGDTLSESNNRVAKFIGDKILWYPNDWGNYFY